MHKLKYILLVAPTLWAEVLLGMIKIMLGLNLVAYLWDPPQSEAAIKQPTAFWLGAAIMLLGTSQIMTVMKEWIRPRFIITCAATGMWIYFMGSQWLAAGSIRPILIYIPILMFNVIVAVRIARQWRNRRI